jgi:Fe-S-cluster containining protein
LKTFLDIKNNSFFFSSCNNCPSKCCDGKEGTIYSQLILDDFELVSRNFPILFTFGELGYLKANILFTNGVDFCPYIKDYQCEIYDERPSICRVYPLSPHLDNNIYIDDSCPAINKNFGIKIVENGEVINLDNYPTLIDYQKKFIDTHLYLEQFNDKKDFKKVLTIKDIDFYSYIGVNKTDKYIKLHLSSLKYLN